METMEKSSEREHAGRDAIKVAFGSATSRLMVPENPPPSRGGIEAGLRGAQNRGPGCYGASPVELFLKELDSRPCSTRGIMFGASTGPRFAHMRKAFEVLQDQCVACGKPQLNSTKQAAEKIPGPTAYQPNTVIQIPPAYKPFGSSTPRVGGGLEQQQKPKDSPGPGHYQHDVIRNRHVEVIGAFGGNTLLKEAVVIKCTNGIKDQCELCHCSTIGDYWEKKINNKKTLILCHGCYEEQLEATKPKYQNLQLFSKVRDCSSIHKHEGTQAQIQLKSDKEQKKLKYREAYLKLYYS